MKRIKAACLEQTVHFMLKEELGHAAAANMVREEYAHYKAALERNRTQYKIVEEKVLPDDSILRLWYRITDCFNYKQNI